MFLFCRAGFGVEFSNWFPEDAQGVELRHGSPTATSWFCYWMACQSAYVTHNASWVSCLVLLFLIWRDSFSPFHLMIWILKCANVFLTKIIDFKVLKMHWIATLTKTFQLCLVSRLFEAGQDELSGTELLIQRQEELHRLQARLSRASIYPGEDPRASIMDLAEPLRNSPLEAGLHPRKSKVMQCSWI